MDALYNTYSEKPDVREEARDWVAQDDDHIFSFAKCCETFNLDPDMVRKAMKKNKWDPTVKKFRLAP
jgi:hypothetical protein